MNIEGIKGSIDLSTENVFKELDRLESRLNKFADSRGNDGDVIANEMKTILNVIAGSQIEFADNLKKAFDTIEEQHLAYGRKARRIERDVTKAMVAEMVERNQAFANAYAKSSQDFLDSQTKLMNANRQLTMSKLADREDRNKDREAGKIKAEELARDREIAEQANEIFMRSMAQQKEKERAIRELAELRMADFRRRKKEHEEAVRLEKKTQKEQEAAVKASLERRNKMIKGFASGATKILKGIVWFPVIANQTMQMFQGVGYTLKAIWDSTYGQLIRTNAELEGYEVRLKSITGSHVLAKEVFRDVLDYAVKTTYTIKETAQAATSLLPVLKGNREELKRILPLVGDIAATFGLSFEEASGNIIKAVSGGIAAADLFRERGISAALGFVPGKKYTGKETLEQFYKEYEKVASLFRGAAKELFFTWDGTISKIQDKWMLFLKDIGDAGIFKNLKIALNIISDRFEKLQDSGEAYSRIVKSISDVLTEVFEKILRLFGVIFSFLKLQFPRIANEVENAFKSTEQLALEKTRNELRAELDRMQSDLMTNPESAIYDDSKAKKIFETLKVYDEQLKNITENGSSASQSLREVFKIGSITSAIDSSKILTDPYNTEFSSPAAFASGALDAKARVMREIADAESAAEAKAKALNDAQSAAMDKVSDNLRKAKLETIKYTQGEWAAFVEETAIEAEKLGQKVTKSMKKDGLDGKDLAGGVVSQYFSSELQGKINEYKYELEQLTKDAKTELRSIGMTDSESAKFEIDNKYDTIHFKDLPVELRASKEAAYQAELAVISANEQAKKYNETLEYQTSIRVASIPSWNTYAQEMEKINTTYKQAAYYASRAAEEEAARNKARAIDVLNANTLAEAKSQIEEVGFELSQFGKTDAEQKIAEIGRALRVFLNSPDEEIRTTGERLKEVMLQLNAQEKLTTFSDGWKVAMADIRNAMMTDGQAIKTFMTNIFSELSSTLSDVFFKVFKGELDSAAEAFSAFADAIMKSIADIMANQIASQLMGGAMGMMAGIFHTGGIAGMGGVQRAVNPLMFVGAPRYHSGGIAGLAPNEVPAILERGERIIPNGYGSSSGAGNVAVSIKNESGQALSVTKSSASQDMSGMVIEIVVDGIARNRGGLRDLLGR